MSDSFSCFRVRNALPIQHVRILESLEVVLPCLHILQDSFVAHAPQHQDPIEGNTSILSRPDRYILGTWTGDDQSTSPLSDLSFQFPAGCCWGGRTPDATGSNYSVKQDR